MQESAHQIDFSAMRHRRRGVQPDIAVPAERALERTQVKLLQASLATKQDPVTRERLKQRLGAMQ